MKGALQYVTARNIFYTKAKDFKNEMSLQQSWIISLAF